MPLLVTIVLDLVLAFALLFSLYVAFCWGELCGIRPGRDKSGLGGFGSALILFLVRWLALGISLLAVARGGERLWLLGGHALLGWLSTKVFDRGLRAVQNDRVAPAWLGFVGGVLVPLPALTLSVVRANPSWFGESPSTYAVVAGALAVPHALCFHRHRASMLRASHR